MEVLLFLSALLSALTGAISGARAPDMPVQCARSIAGAHTPAEAGVAAIPALPSYLALARSPLRQVADTAPFVLVDFRVFADAPLYLSKPRT